MLVPALLLHSPRHALKTGLQHNSAAVATVRSARDISSSHALAGLSGRENFSASSKLLPSSDLTLSHHRVRSPELDAALVCVAPNLIQIAGPRGSADQPPSFFPIQSPGRSPPLS